MSNDALRLEPARTIIAAFGDGDLTAGINEVASITRRHKSRVLRWMYPESKGGTGGAIPGPTIRSLYDEAVRRKLPLDAGIFLGATVEAAE